MKNRQEKKLADLTRQNVSLSSEVRSQSMKLSALQDENLRLLNLAGNVHYVEVSSESDSSDQLVQLKKEKEELSLFCQQCSVIFHGAIVSQKGFPGE